MTLSTVPPGTFDQEVAASTADARRRALADDDARVRHDLVNALTAIEGAATILAGDDLSAADRTVIGGLLGTSVKRLRSLLDPGARSPVSVADVAAEVTGEPDWRGAVAVDVGPGLVTTVTAGALAEDLRQLMTAARERSPSAPLSLHGRRNGQSVELWLETGAPNDVTSPLPVAFHVGAGMVRDQGGDLRVEAREHGAQAIVIRLPAAPDDRDGDDPDA